MVANVGAFVFLIFQTEKKKINSIDQSIRYCLRFISNTGKKPIEYIVYAGAKIRWNPSSGFFPVWSKNSNNPHQLTSKQQLVNLKGSKCDLNKSI